MALADLTAFRAAQAAPSQRLDLVKTHVSTAGFHWNSTWIKPGIPPAGSAPGASAVPNRTTTGALGQLNKSAGTLLMWLQQYSAGDVNTAHGKIMIADRLVHMGGLDGTNATPQTVSTSALTRFTTGDGVVAAIEIYNTLGTTGTTITASYTNQAGTAGQVSQPIDIGTANRNGVGVMLPLSLAAGDTGVRAVSTVTLAGTTGTVGNFGVTLYKPLLVIPFAAGMTFNTDCDPLKTLGGFVAQVPDDACLWLSFMINGAQTEVPSCDVMFTEA